ncbi:MAG: N4-gp56 family major capsid protein [Vampirovibrionales bacterium]|nr:N4-gp56 family major capsid protein [Vampirovibrionales bacterium]
MGDTFSTLSQEAKSFYDRKLLSRAMPILGMTRAAQQRNILKNSGNQVEYRRFNTLSTSTVALTEAVTPSAASLSIGTVTGTVAQYGNYVQISDALDLMAIDPIITEATDLLGENAAQSIEEIVRSELVTGTSVVYATGSARDEQAATNPITLSLVRKAVRTLMVNDAVPFDSGRDESGFGGLYIGFIHPRQWYDLLGDTAVQNVFTYSDPEKLYTMKAPILGQVAWVVTTKAPVFAEEGALEADVYGAIICGQNAFGVVDVAGTGRFQTIAKPLGSAGSADPLDQRASVGWKSFQLPKILNNNFMIRIESGVSA